MSLISREPNRLPWRQIALQAMTRQKPHYQGPDRRGGAGMRAEDCREQARICFAQAVAADDPELRERFRQRGEHWMIRWRNWSPRGFNPT